MTKKAPPKKHAPKPVNRHSPRTIVAGEMVSMADDKKPDEPKPAEESDTPKDMAPEPRRGQDDQGSP